MSRRGANLNNFIDLQEPESAVIDIVLKLCDVFENKLTPVQRRLLLIDKLNRYNYTEHNVIVRRVNGHRITALPNHEWNTRVSVNVDVVPTVKVGDVVRVHGKWVGYDGCSTHVIKQYASGEQSTCVKCVKLNEWSPNRNGNMLGNICVGVLVNDDTYDAAVSTDDYIHINFRVVLSEFIAGVLVINGVQVMKT